MNSSELAENFKLKVIDKNLVEKWLNFYAIQLRDDLSIQSDLLIRKAESQIYIEDKKIKPNMSIINPIEFKSKKSLQVVDSKKKFKSKPILESISMLLLLLNKSSRLVNKFLCENKKCDDEKVSFFQENLNVQNFDLDIILNSLTTSILEIINHLSYLNKALTQLEQEQIGLQEFKIQDKSNLLLSPFKKNNDDSESNFITLKQSNQVVKELHSIANTLMILIVSISDIENLKNSRQLIKNLINIVEKLISEEFNYFPAVINSIQASLSHLVALNSIETVGFLEKNEILLKKMVQSCFRILSKSINNLEDNSYPRITRDISLTFVVNNNIFKFIVNNFGNNFWQSELTESCIMQCLYVVFEKCVYDPKNYDIIYSIVDFFFTFSEKQPESLAKSDFNTRTCLLVSKLFEHSSLISVNIIFF